MNQSLGTKVRTVFQGWKLKNAVRHENVNIVQHLATPELFETLSDSMVAQIMTQACKNASKMKPTGRSERILEHLLHNGGVLSIHCIHTTYKDNKPSLGVLGYKWMQMAVDCNAVHDNLKSTMLRECIHDHKHNARQYGNELSESIVAKWPEHFIRQQFYIQNRDDFWKHVTEKGSDKLLRTLIEITPQSYLTIDYFKKLHRRDDYPSPLSLETLEALHQKGFHVDRLVHLWVTGRDGVKTPNLERHLDRNHTLLVNIRTWEEYSIAQQRQRLMDQIAADPHADSPKVKARKM